MFLVNSRFHLVSAAVASSGSKSHHQPRPPFSRSYGGNLPSSFNIVLSSALVCSTYPPVLVWGTVFMMVLFPGTTSLHTQSVKHAQLTSSVTSIRFRNINLIPIGYGFRPRLRGRLTLLRLALNRNPWAFGDSVSHTVCRYSCQHSHFRYLHLPSRCRLHRPTERFATTHKMCPQLR